MNDNDLINTAVSGFTPYQFNPQSLQVMPTGFDRTATRAEQRISDTQKRVNDLVKLDPTNPLATFITMMGANQNNTLREELMGLRGQAMGSSIRGNKRKKILADIKALDYGDALGLYAREKHGSDLDATLNDPDLMKGLEEIATRRKELSLSDRAELIGDAAKMMKFVHATRDMGGASEDDKKLAREYEKTLPMIWDTLRGIHKMSERQITSEISKVSTPSATKKVADNPSTIVNESEEAKGDPVVARKKEGIAILQGKKIEGFDPLVPEETTGGKIKKGIQENVINPTFNYIKNWDENKKDWSWKPPFYKNLGDLFYKPLPQELTDEGWEKTQMRLARPKTSKVGDKLPEMRDVTYNNSTGVYVGERGGRVKPYFVGDTANGVKKTFGTAKEAWLFASTYIPQSPKADRKLDSTIMDSIGTGASGSYGTDEPSKSKGDDSLEAKVSKPPREYPNVLKSDARTKEEKSMAPWERGFWGGKVSGGIKKIKELNQYVLDNHKQYHPAWAYNNPRKSNDAVAQDVATLYLAGKKKVGAEGWGMVLDMVEKLGGVGGDALKYLLTPADAEGAIPNESTEMGSGNNINAGGSNLGGVGKTDKRDGGFAGHNPARSVDQFLSDPFIDAMVTAESNGRERAIGYKLIEEKGASGRVKLVHAKDKEGKKIPASYGLMQVTINTALSTKAGKEILRGLNPKVKEDREEIKSRLFDPFNNLRIATEFSNTLRDQLNKNKYASKFSPIELNQLISAAYNYKGENFVKDVIDKHKPTNLRDLLHRASIPKETRRQIRVVGQALKKGDR